MNRTVASTKDVQIPRCVDEEDYTISSHYVSIGIDISKKRLDIYGADTDLPNHVANQPDDIHRLVSLLTKAPPHIIVCEPSGGYERLLVATLQEAKLPIAVVNARQIRDFARAKGILAKTDALDARILAEYGALFKPKPTIAKPSVELAQHVARRRQLVDMLRIEKQHSEHLAPPILKKGSDTHRAWLQTHIDQIDTAIAALIDQDHMLKQRHTLLTSCNGVGNITAMTLIAELPELGNASNVYFLRHSIHFIPET